MGTAKLLQDLNLMPELFYISDRVYLKAMFIRYFYGRACDTPFDSMRDYLNLENLENFKIAYPSKYIYFIYKETFWKFVDSGAIRI